MPDDPGFLIDSDVLIEASRRYYAFDLAPGFWRTLEDACESRRVLSIDRVLTELIDRGTPDRLADWAGGELDPAFFLPTDAPGVVAAFGELMAWVAGSTHYTQAAKSQFARVADGWLVACAKVTGRTVVTQEGRNDAKKSGVPIPNLCLAFDVPCVDTFAMLRALGVRLDRGGGAARGDEGE